LLAQEAHFARKEPSALNLWSKNTYEDTNCIDDVQLAILSSVVPRSLFFLLARSPASILVVENQLKSASSKMVDGMNPSC
jgi:hypothetical protein